MDFLVARLQWFGETHNRFPFPVGVDANEGLEPPHQFSVRVTSLSSSLSHIARTSIGIRSASSRNGFA